MSKATFLGLLAGFLFGFCVLGPLMMWASSL
jgi:tetrahydromethanopterin S-methyltransferase subunit F